MVDTVLPIANGFYTSDSLPVSAQNCVNWYPHINELPALNQEILFGTPGITNGIEFSDEPCRGIITFGDTLYPDKVYFVNGNNLYSWDGTSPDVVYIVPTPVGGILGTGLVSMAISQSQLMIVVPGEDGYIVEKGYGGSPDTVVLITDGDFKANGYPQAVVFVDGYFVCPTDEGGKFIISALNDGLSWNALDFGTAESSPDEAVSAVVVRNQLFIVGSNTTEQFPNVPNGAGFPFQRSGLFLSRGALTPLSVVACDDTFMMIGGGKNESPAVWALDGNSLVKKSTSAIDTILQQLADVDNNTINAWTYAQAGHYFVGFGLPNTTIVYDLTTDRWHERSSRIYEGGVYTNVPYRVQGFALLRQILVASDNIDGRIGVASLDSYTEYDMEIVRTFTTQPFQNNMQPFFVPKLELTVESGVGLLDDDQPTNAVNPSVQLQISRDGGKTWGETRTRLIGAMGEYNTRAVWRRNGRCARFDVYRFVMSDPVKPVVIQLTAQVEGADDAAA